MNLVRKTESPALFDTSTIPGWGVDADPRNDPTYPMRDQTQDHGLTRQWDRPPIQRTDVEILQSIEHVRRPAVVGTSTPPSGLSGVLRRLAFRWSESNWLHWLLLLGADRINVVEGVVDDLAHAKLPNIPGEMGIRAELAHNKRGFATKVAVVAGLTLTVALLARRGSAQRIEDAGER
ncbi:hypothetical protein SAMN03159338_3823 [Sphingomonas sp. NFR04]|uniref:hypothetical protein n=1 Tax=Sphingomonas TaxID=13687 RepID=UPI0008ED1D70|nr:hypothetical protein [Sphingomonas sp. NFR04]SFK28122.1 hypothetical protein SAMN03159338_3823 [Sphingomonas sp. NFR04]